MKTKILLLSLCALGVLGGASPAHAEWYLGGFASAAGADADFEYTGGKDRAEYDIGWGVAGYGGYQFAGGIRTELELGHRSAAVRNIDTSITSPDSGDTHVETAMINFIYGYQNKTRFTPYVGIGGGLANVRYDLVKTVASDTVHDEKVLAAGQGIVGVEARVSGNWAATLDYRYLFTESTSLRNSGGVAVDTDYSSQSVNVGLRYRF